jgi:hypothetical protein
MALTLEQRINEAREEVASHQADLHLHISNLDVEATRASALVLDKAKAKVERLVAQHERAQGTTREVPQETTAERRAKLEAELAALRKEEDAEKKALMASVKPVMKYTVMPTPPRDRWDFLGDEMCVFYTIDGQCTNLDEVKATGAMSPHSGSMRYLFNLATSRLVCHVSGGNIHLAATHEAYADVSAFISEHPEGGDITEIVLRHKNTGRW